jgi:hypothetical protein
MSYARNLTHELFMQNLLHHLESDLNTRINEYTSLDLLLKCINEHGLLYVILGQEMRDSLHLAEMDPTVVNKLENEIINRCIKPYAQSILILQKCATNICDGLNEVKNTEAILEFRKQVLQLENYAKFLTGTLENAYENWYVLLDRSKLFMLPAWVKGLLFIPHTKPEIVNSVSRQFNIGNAHANLTNSTIVKCNEEIHQALKTITLLMTIEKAVQRSTPSRTYTPINLVYSTPVVVNSDPACQKWQSIWDANDKVFLIDNMLDLLKLYLKENLPSKSIFGNYNAYRVSRICQECEIDSDTRMSVNDVISKLTELTIKNSNDPLALIIKVIKANCKHVASSAITYKRNDN